jgi:hypothetical protein
MTVSGLGATLQFVNRGIRYDKIVPTMLYDRPKPLGVGHFLRSVGRVQVADDRRIKIQFQFFHGVTFSPIVYVKSVNISTRNSEGQRQVIAGKIYFRIKEESI